MQLTAQRMSVQDFLALKERDRPQCEYVDGEFFAMTGPTRRHQLIAGNLFYHARRAGGARCQIFSAGMMVRVQAHNSLYLPDVFGSCDPDDSEEQYVSSPCFIIEVLSPSTAHVDRREKRLAYSTLKSLDEYVLVSQQRMHVSVYRADGGVWASQMLDMPTDVLELKCIELRVSVADIYEGVRLPPLQVRDSDSPWWTEQEIEYALS